jgi:hypothetical protein
MPIRKKTDYIFLHILAFLFIIWYDESTLFLRDIFVEGVLIHEQQKSYSGFHFNSDGCRNAGFLYHTGE